MKDERSDPCPILLKRLSMRCRIFGASWFASESDWLSSVNGFERTIFVSYMETPEEEDFTIFHNRSTRILQWYDLESVLKNCDYEILHW